MAGLDDILGNQTLRTIFVWQVAAQVIGAVLDPFWAQIRHAVNTEHPEGLIPPADLADMVVRHRVAITDAITEALGSGISEDRFRRLVTNVGEPIGLEQALEALRRGHIPEDGPPGSPSVGEAVRTARYMDEWLPVILALRYAVPSPGEVIDGALKAHLADDVARRKFSEAGLDPDTDFEWMLGARGNPPGLTDVARLVHRGIIPEAGLGPDVLSFEQAVRESGYMNKWTAALFAGFTYVPPVRSVVPLLRAGAITSAQAAALFAENGVRPEDAAAYIGEATAGHTSTEKHLAKSDVETLYSDGAIDHATAVELLGALGYPAPAAAWLLTLVELRKEVAFLDKAVARVQAYYVARKIDRAHAIDALNTLHVPAAQVSQLLVSWDLERTASVRILTEAQIVDAWAEAVLDQAAAEAELVAIGYTPFDAWVLLSIKNKGPLGSPPAKGPAPSGNIT